jgi:putative hydrolase of the HAD superfamily
MAYTTRRERCPLGAVETWIFDLDNTLYPTSCRLFEQVQRRMNEYICARLAVTPDQAAELRRRFFLEYGTTMNGLMAVHRIDPHDFLAFVHDVDLACVPPDPALVAALKRLDGRKIVHTNGSVRHAERLLDHLGIGDSFSGIIDIVAADFAPKPALAGYRELLRRHAVAPATALMVEDMARNLAPAAELGMTTAWLRNTIDWAAAESEGDYIHHVVDELAGFLAAAVVLREGPPAGGSSQMSVAETMHRKLTARFAPTRLDIVDESHRHAGHVGAHPGGESHFAVTIASAAFVGLGRVARQRLVYDTLAEELASGVHALALTTLSPSEDRGGNRG